VSKFLLDANLSPNTAAFLTETFGLDVVHQDDILPGSPTDDEVVEVAKGQQRVIITFDRGFGEQYYQQERGQLGVIVLRLRNQRRPSVEQTLARFFRDEAPNLDLDTSLVIIDEGTVRVRSSQ
jgi:predicted nuclease of predicted toxin-antitoxin system